MANELRPYPSGTVLRKGQRTIDYIRNVHLTLYGAGVLNADLN